MFEARARSRRHDAVHIDVVPMVDCMLVLVIFLVVSSVFVQDPGVEVDRPDVSGESGTTQTTLLIAITADDRIYFDGQEIQPSQVRTVLKQAALGMDAPLIVRADQASSHGMFAFVHAEAKAAGIAQVLFATARSSGLSSTPASVAVQP